MKSFRKLKDYGRIPSTPPPTGEKDGGLMDLEEELDQERKYLCALCMENKELEEILQNLDAEIAYIKSNFPQQIAGDKKIHASNDYWFKYESKMELIRKLEREKKNLESEIRQLEEQGMINLDSLTQSELIMYVKQLERTKTNLLSDLRSKEWGLDKQAKDIHHLTETKKALQAEIRHYDKELAMFRHYKKNSCPSASQTDRRGSNGGADERKFKTWKQKEKTRAEDRGKPGEDKQNLSLSQEEIPADSKSDVMFSSLDESKLERMESESPNPAFQRIKGEMAEGKRTADPKRGSGKKTVSIGPLPEISKSPSPSTGNSKRVKSETKVGTDSPENRNPTKPIKIIVTYETKRTAIADIKSEDQREEEVKEELEEEEKKKKKKKEMAEEERKSEGFPSISEEVYEEDFEDSEGDKSMGEGKNIGYLTTRV